MLNKSWIISIYNNSKVGYAEIQKILKKDKHGEGTLASACVCVFKENNKNAGVWTCARGLHRKVSPFLLAYN